ncbi:MAG: aldo/keto reductase [Alsobacter sp.]
MTVLQEKRRLSKSDLLVSTLCLGTMTFGTPVAEPDAIRVVHEALDLGVNFIDTADIYEGYARQLGSSGGVAEGIVGKALAGRRDRVVITSKVGNPVGHAKDEKGLGEAHITRQLERSLTLLRTDYLDVYELHRTDPDTDLRETIQTVGRLITKGLVRYWGFSNFPAEDIETMMELCAETGTPEPIVAQPLYNWLKRDVEKGYLPACRAHGISITPYQPLQGGLLTGKYKRAAAPPQDSRAIEQARWLPAFDEALFDAVEAFEHEARLLGRSPVAHALRWLLDQPGVASVVVGCKTIDQLGQLATAVGA